MRRRPGPLYRRACSPRAQGRRIRAPRSWRAHRVCGGVRGFTLVELILALALTLTIVASVFTLINPANGAFQSQPEAADLQQRLRAATDALSRDLSTAGGDPFLALGVDDTTPLRAAGVFPLRVGRVSADAAGTFSAARITVWSVGPDAVQARLAAPLASASGTATFVPGAGCRSGADSCGFQNGMTTVVLGVAGAWDLFSVSAVSGNSVTLQHNLRDAALVHPAGESTIAEATIRSYMTKTDTAGVPRLVRYDGGGGADVPVIDHVVDLTFEYLGDAQPPAPVVGSDPLAPRATYGPAPPPQTSPATSYPPGENCVFARTPSGLVVSRLTALSAGPVLVPLQPAWLTDGPWCPDAANPNRYDADLLRVRAIGVNLRIEAAIDALRGPAGLLFARGGTARGPRIVPDRMARVVVAPRALSLWR